MIKSINYFRVSQGQGSRTDLQEMIEVDKSRFFERKLFQGRLFWQICRTGAHPLFSSVDGLQEHIHNLWDKMFPDQNFDVDQCFLIWPGFPVRAIGLKRTTCICNGKNPG